MEDILLHFPSDEFTLQTSKKSEEVDEEKNTGKLIFISLICEGEEKFYVIHLSKDIAGVSNCIAHDQLNDWDEEANLIRH